MFANYVTLLMTVFHLCMSLNFPSLKGLIARLHKPRITLEQETLSGFETPSTHGKIKL